METNKTSHPRRRKLLETIVLILLVFGNIFFGINYYLQLQEVKKINQQLQAEQTNAKVVNFLNLFVEKVLKTDQPVSFDDRLKLENAVRDINDPNILAKWEQFTGGQTVDQIQAAVKDLLEALVRKIA